MWVLTLVARVPVVCKPLRLLCTAMAATTGARASLRSKCVVARDASKTQSRPDARAAAIIVAFERVSPLDDVVYVLNDGNGDNVLLFAGFTCTRMARPMRQRRNVQQKTMHSFSIFTLYARIK